MSGSKDKNTTITVPNHVKFIMGGMSGMGATSIVQPLDLVKTRLQISTPGQYSSTGHCIQTVYSGEGIRGFYVGLSAALLRQIVYTSTRLGIYTTLMDQKTSDGKPPPLWKKGLYGMIAGGTGAAVANPTEVCLIRMTADGRLPAEERRG